MKPVQDLQSKWETCCSPDDFNKLICKPPAWLSWKWEGGVLHTARSLTSTTPAPPTTFFLISELPLALTDKKNITCPSPGPYSDGTTEFWHWTGSSWVQPRRTESPLLIYWTCSVLSNPALGSGSAQGQSHHLPRWQASTRARGVTTKEESSACCNPQSQTGHIAICVIFFFSINERRLRNHLFSAGTLQWDKESPKPRLCMHRTCQKWKSVGKGLCWLLIQTHVFNGIKEPKNKGRRHQARDHVKGSL